MSAPLTFLFTDLENSTQLWERAPQAMRTALAQHDELMHRVIEGHAGRVVKDTGDGVMAVFESPIEAIAGAFEAQRAMAASVWPAETGPLKVRMGVHTGESQERDGDFFGRTLNLAARVMGIGHGGQALVSGATAHLVGGDLPDRAHLTSLGDHRLKGLAAPVAIYQLRHPGLAGDFPPLRSLSVLKHIGPRGALAAPFTDRPKAPARFEHRAQAEECGSRSSFEAQGSPHCVGAWVPKGELGVSPNWYRFWDRGSWSEWRADRRQWAPYRKERNRTRLSSLETSHRTRRLKSQLADLNRTLAWVNRIGPRKLPIETAKTENGLAAITGVRLLELRRVDGKDKWTHTDSGSVHFTDRRMVFSGAKKSVEFRYNKIDTMAPKRRGLLVAVSTRKKPHTLSGPVAELHATLLGCMDYADGADPAARYQHDRDGAAEALGNAQQERAGLATHLESLEKPKRPVSPAWIPATLVFVLLAAVSPSSPPVASQTATTSGAPTTATTTVRTAPQATADQAASTTSIRLAASTTTSSVGRNPDGEVAAGLPSDPVVVVLPIGDESGIAGTGAYIDRVTDGDTIDVVLPDGTIDTVRLIGVNAPEDDECLADEATRWLEDAVHGRDVVLVTDVTDRDRYGRLLRYVWLADDDGQGGYFVNGALVGEGMAIARRYEPDTAWAEILAVEQQKAMEAGKGMWDLDACGSVADGNLEILFINYDADGDDNQNLNGEHVLIRNSGTAPADLTNWVLKDESASHRYTFPAGFTALAGESFRIYSGCGTDTGAQLYWCNRTSAIWNNDGDTGFLLDPAGNIHDSWSYAPQTTTTTSNSTTSTTATATTSPSNCHPSYTPCVPIVSDVDCIDGSGDGPYYVGRVTVIGPDEYRLDRDNDGIGCDNSPPHRP